MKYRGESYSDLGSKLKALRHELGMTQKELSEGIVTRNMLSRIENSEALPSLSTLTELASRLSVPVGYLIDDHDDGTKLKNERLLSMIKKEFSVGNYDLCLQYLKNLEYYPEEREVYTAKSMYLLGVEKMNSDAPVKEAQRLISDSLKKESLLEKHMACEGKAYRALLDGFAFSPESEKEAQFISNVSKYADSPCDIALFSSFVAFSEKTDAAVLRQSAQILIYENKGYKLLSDGIAAYKCGEFKAAFSRLAVAKSCVLPSPIRAFLLTLLEKTSASLSDFEKAYSYMNERKALTEKLLKKV